MTQDLARKEEAMRNQISNVRYPEMPSDRKRTRRSTIEEDIYTVILDVYDKMKYLIAINTLLAIMIAIMAVFIANI